MKLSAQRESLLKPLQYVSGVIERRQTLPILSNTLISVHGGVLSMTGTDLEVEMVARVALEGAEEGDITLPARKLMDICRALPEGAQVEISVDRERAVIRSGRSRFTLGTLGATEFPSIDPIEAPFEVGLTQKALRRLLEQTQFAMAQQDVRYYLNGLMLELGNGYIRAVATDGHRLALCEAKAELEMTETREVIVPRKAVSELLRLLQGSDEELRLQVGRNHLRVELAEAIFTSKLIDGKFPDYDRVIPSGGRLEVLCGRDELRQAFSRASVLSNEKYRGMRLQLAPGLLRATVHNPEQEEAEEEIEVSYDGEEFEIGFNVAYFLDALGAIDAERVSVRLTDANSSCLVQGENDTECKYVIMPMRL
ncbi:MAG: DNA polymerase III subunit beta [Pseudomonadota bacterium]|nr:MAG: DNA polymerase III subunit beta [Pseudomonadota bacterium]